MKLKYCGNLFPSSKKGSLAEPILNGALLLKLVVTIFIVVYIWFEFQNSMALTIAGTPIEVTLTAVMGNLRAAYLTFDYVFPFLVGGLIILSLIFAFKTGANIAWGFLSLIFWGIALLMSVVYVNTFASIAVALPTMYTSFPIIAAIMENLNWVIFAWIVLITIVMFRKNNTEDDNSPQRRYYNGE
jgi:hypothetical protein